MLLNGGSLAIGLNPDGALRQLRRSYSGRLLWVDALCINKEDVKEGSQQAWLMGRTYFTLERVVAWLGTERSEHCILAHTEP